MRGPNDIRVLATGFGSFPGARVNVSAALASGLARAAPRLARLASVRLRIAILPVSWRRAAPALRHCLESARPDIVVLIGLAGRRPALSVETQALNRRSTLRPDIDKRMAPSRFVRAGGAQRLASRAPASQLVAALRRAGAPAFASIDAGDYLCNEVLYLALESEARVVAFVHAPRPRDPCAPRSRRSSAARRPRLETMTQALVACVPSLVAAWRARQPGGGEAARA